jgi:hypothetical protein
LKPPLNPPTKIAQGLPRAPNLQVQLHQLLTPLKKPPVPIIPFPSQTMKTHNFHRPTDFRQRPSPANPNFCALTPHVFRSISGAKNLHPATSALAKLRLNSANCGIRAIWIKRSDARFSASATLKAAPSPPEMTRS